MTAMPTALQKKVLHQLQAMVQRDWVSLPLPIVHRIHRCELPVALWIYNQQLSKYHALLVGINGPQGSGKGTTSACLKVILEHYFGLRVLVVSIDDFYFTKAERARLAQQIHPLLATRGVPGTHDVELAINTLAKLKYEQQLATYQLPQFNKASDDRFEQSAWLTCQAPVDVVLFEGWCVAALPEKDQALVQPINQLEAVEDKEGIWRRYVNAALSAQYRELFALLDNTLLFQYGDFSWVADWRKEQETENAKKAEAKGLPTNGIMSDADIDRFVLFYERVTRSCQQELPEHTDVIIKLMKDRSVSEMIWNPSNMD